jgi:hypothetical protein
MKIIDIDEMARANGYPHIDANGVPTGHTEEEFPAELDVVLSEAYGIDFAKVMQLIASGELDEDEITDELLFSPQFKYEPYPGFKPKPHLFVLRSNPE